MTRSSKFHADLTYAVLPQQKPNVITCYAEAAAETGGVTAAAQSVAVNASHGAVITSLGGGCRVMPTQSKSTQVTAP
jgi:hypothetical protein